MKVLRQFTKRFKNVIVQYPRSQTNIVIIHITTASVAIAKSTFYILHKSVWEFVNWAINKRGNRDSFSKVPLVRKFSSKVVYMFTI